MGWPAPARADPLVPTPGRTIADLLPAVHRASTARPPGTVSVRLELPAAERWVVLLVDGLGRALLDHCAELAPVLTAGTELGGVTSCVPSTTAVSLTSLGTGLAPARHGICGYAFWLPQAGAVFHPLSWQPEVPVPGVGESTPHFAERGWAQVNLTEFADTGLTRAAFGESVRPAAFIGVDEDDGDGRVAAVVRASAAWPRVYTYERRLDKVGHLHGWRSESWRATLTAIDAWVGRLRAELPDDVRLVVTGDHGMVDVPGRNLVSVADEPHLARGVTRVFGEPRFVHLHTTEPDQVRARWQDWFGDHAWVTTRDGAIAADWFGPADDTRTGRVPERIGDVIVAMRTDWGVLPRRDVAMGRLIGHHGSLTDAEMRIPCIVL